MAVAGLGFSLSLPLSHGALACWTGAIARELVSGATGGQRLDPAVPGPDLAEPAAATCDCTHFPHLPTLVRGQRSWVARHELTDHDQPGRLVRV